MLQLTLCTSWKPVHLSHTLLGAPSHEPKDRIDQHAHHNRQLSPSRPNSVFSKAPYQRPQRPEEPRHVTPQHIVQTTLLNGKSRAPSRIRFPSQSWRGVRGCAVQPSVLQDTHLSRRGHGVGCVREGQVGLEVRTQACYFLRSEAGGEQAVEALRRWGYGRGAPPLCGNVTAALGTAAGAAVAGRGLESVMLRLEGRLGVLREGGLAAQLGRSERVS